MIISQTPHRISFLGGGTDLPEWLNEHDGTVIGAAINVYSYMLVKKLPPFHQYKSRFVYSELESVITHEEIKHNAIRETLKCLSFEEGIELFHSSDVPSKSGTGSSSTFLVGLLKALTSLRGEFYPPQRLAKLATEIEQERLNGGVGRQDQVFAAHGGVNLVKFKNRETIIAPISSPAKLSELENHLLLFYTGIQRTSSDITKGYTKCIKERSKQMFEMMALTEAGLNTIYKGDWKELGRLIDTSWRLKSSLPGVTNERLSDWYAKARVWGAYGGKVTGAGGGGSILLVAPPDTHVKLRNNLEAEGLLCIPFGFDYQGSQVIYAR